MKNFNKIEKNIERDKKFKQELEKMGWVVMRFWAENEVNENLEKCIKKIEAKINEIKDN